MTAVDGDDEMGWDGIGIGIGIGMSHGRVGNECILDMAGV